MIALEASGLTIRRGGRAILEDVHLRAQAGEFIAVIGANGAGKSTLLAALAGLLAPDAGAIFWGGRPLAVLRPAERARLRAYLPQNPRCEWPISVERLVALGLTPVLPAFGDLPECERSKVNAMIEACDLQGHRAQAATTLSGGELARAMLARALVSEPQLLIVDEPMVGLDPRHVLDSVTRLRNYAGGGRLVLAAVHDLTLAMRFASRVVALRNGRVAADGTPQEMLDDRLIRSIFQVEARVLNVNGASFVDYLGPS